VREVVAVLPAASVEDTSTPAGRPLSEPEWSRVGAVGRHSGCDAVDRDGRACLGRAGDYDAVTSFRRVDRVVATFDAVIATVVPRSTSECARVVAVLPAASVEDTVNASGPSAVGAGMVAV
jgi:hypothetical protein